MSTIAAGLILAGGRSRRFGGDKALAPLDGRSLLERAADALRPWASHVAVSASVETAAGAAAHRLGLPVLSDRAGLAHGPLAGILAGLEWSNVLNANWMISLPCDVVLLPADTFSRLLGAVTKANSAYAVTAQGPHTLCAVWSVESKDVLEAVLAAGVHPPVRDILKLLGAAPVLFEESGSFLNINTKRDLLAAERALSS
ncbi:MAG TPA: molybdenum cofactor guanylyltransferase [Rhizomicrobium sp.]|nr:molybdenum cofactor guanylyltransferase [Rhizomicrobium sp.]